MSFPETSLRSYQRRIFGDLLGRSAGLWHDRRHLHQVPERFEPRRIPGTEGELARQLFFWPAGDWLGYWDMARNQLKRIRPSGGKPEFLANSDNPFSPSLTTDDRIIFHNGRDLVWIPVHGGQPQLFFRPGAAIYGVQLLPDNKTIIYTTGDWPPLENLKIAVRSIDKDDETILFRAHPVTYLPAGYLVYGSGNDLAARRFDYETRSLAGEVTLVRDVLVSGSRMQYQVSPGGDHLAYFKNASGGTRAESHYRAPGLREAREGAGAEVSGPFRKSPSRVEQPRRSVQANRLTALNSTQSGCGVDWISTIGRHSVTSFTLYRVRCLSIAYTFQPNQIVCRDFSLLNPVP